MQPPLSDRELVDRFMGTLTGPFFNHLIESSSYDFTELILTVEQFESSIKRGKIQVVVSSSIEKKPFKKEASVVYGPRRQVKPECAKPSMHW